MCNFISWIEKDNHLYYLDDDKVFSKEGRQLQKQCQDNDLLGHEAIRAYFVHLHGIPIQEGRDCEVNNFWELDKLPIELASKISAFDAHWGRMFKQGMFSNFVLGELVENAPTIWKAKAWKQLLAQGSSERDLYCMLRTTSDFYKAKAWEQLLLQRPSSDILYMLVSYTPDEYAVKAQQILDSR